jgi:hypothetical protein
MTGFIYVVVLEIHCLFVLCNLLSKLTRSFWRDHTEMVSRFCAILQTQRQRQTPTNKVPFIVNIGLLLKLKYIFHLSSLLFCTPARTSCSKLLTATKGKTVFLGSPHYFRWFTHNLHGLTKLSNIMLYSMAILGTAKITHHFWWPTRSRQI